MKIILNEDRRKILLNTLSSEQREYIMNYIKRGKKTAFANEMALSKGIILPEEISDLEIERMLNEWILIDYIDHGSVSLDLRCECGRPLRRQYIVKHISTGAVKKFGIDHFQEHTGFSPEIIKEIIRGFSKIDYELDEILIKHERNWTLDPLYLTIPESKLPIEIQEMLGLGLPLLERHINRLKILLNEIPKPTISIQNSEPRFEEKAQFNLFDYDFQEKKKSPDYLNVSMMYAGDYKFSFEYEEFIKDLLEEGISSARVMSEQLINIKSAPNDRYVTGKSKIYYSVCLFLDKLVGAGECTLQYTSQSDRKYKRNEKSGLS